MALIQKTRRGDMGQVVPLLLSWTAIISVDHLDFSPTLSLFSSPSASLTLTFSASQSYSLFSTTLTETFRELERERRERERQRIVFCLANFFNPEVFRH